MKSLYDRAMEYVGNRDQWELKQRLFSQMRHNGLPRLHKPWPGAADLHFPLIDMNIRKAKPFWEAQATGNDKIASFVALKEQLQSFTTAAADYFDWEIRQNSNYLIELLRMIDFMCLRGRGVMKIVVDPFEDYKIVCDAIDPVMIIMADGADDFNDADEFVHVQHMSVAGYRRNLRYVQDESLINAIRGNSERELDSGILQDKQAREGINFSKNKQQIIVWEHYIKTVGGWHVHTYGPQAPDRLLRRPFIMPYVCANKPSLPFFSIRMEVKDKGWYSPRGLAEVCAAFEQYCSKLWCEKTDAMTIGNRPILTSKDPIPNVANLRWVPGEFIPGGVTAVQPATPAFSFDQELAFARETAEQQSQLPDFGITRTGQPGTTGGPRTATENNRIASLQTVGTESSGRLFRMDLGKMYSHMWALMLQFRRKKVSYWTGVELKELPEQARHDAYLVMPDGAPDAWNKQQRQQRADARLQKYAGNPSVDQDALVKDSLAADDPKLAYTLFIPSGVKQASEAEDEAGEIVIMQDGFPAAVKPNEDHVTRIHVLLSWLQKQMATGAPLDPTARQRIQQHLLVHFQYLKKQQPIVAKQLLQEIQQAESSQPMQPMGPPAAMAGPVT